MCGCCEFFPWHREEQGCDRARASLEVAYSPLFHTKPSQFIQPTHTPIYPFSSPFAGTRGLFSLCCCCGSDREDIYPRSSPALFSFSLFYSFPLFSSLLFCLPSPSTHHPISLLIPLPSLFAPHSSLSPLFHSYPPFTHTHIYLSSHPQDTPRPFPPSL